MPAKAQTPTLLSLLPPSLELVYMPFPNYRDTAGCLTPVHAKAQLDLVESLADDIAYARLNGHWPKNASGRRHLAHWWAKYNFDDFDVLLHYGKTLACYHYPARTATFVGRLISFGLNEQELTQFQFSGNDVYCAHRLYLQSRFDYGTYQFAEASYVGQSLTVQELMPEWPLNPMYEEPKPKRKPQDFEQLLKNLRKKET